VTYDWDAEKDAANFAKHGVSFEAVRDFDWTTAVEAEDINYEYSEKRMQALGLIGRRYHVSV
jgi:uncharacterized DUF497 family protein